MSHPMALRPWIVMCPLMLALGALTVEASPRRNDPRSPCEPCFHCAAEPAASRVVRVKMYNQTRFNRSVFAAILEITNRIWAPYGVSVEPAEHPDAVTVVLASGTLRDDTGPIPAAVGDTIFTNGHATPYIRLWLGAAELVAENSDADGRPFMMKSSTERDAVLLRILGVALAHELAHYLLDTAHHSADGLLRSTLTARDMAHPNPAHLRLTRKQQEVMCPKPAAAIPQ